MVESNKQLAKGEKKVLDTSASQGKQEAWAVGRYLKISPIKVRDLVRLIRGKSVAEAETILKFSLHRGGEFALKVLRSAEANAGAGFSKEGWVVTDARADKGPIFRRKVDMKARSLRGVISTPSTHIRVVVKQQVSRPVGKEKHGA